jgi:hypothetical protein
MLLIYLSAYLIIFFTSLRCKQKIILLSYNLPYLLYLDLFMCRKNFRFLSGENFLVFCMLKHLLFHRMKNFSFFRLAKKISFFVEFFFVFEKFIFRYRTFRKMMAIPIWDSLFSFRFHSYQLKSQLAYTVRLGST